MFGRRGLELVFELLDLLGELLLVFFGERPIAEFFGQGLDLLLGFGKVSFGECFGGPVGGTLLQVFHRGQGFPHLVGGTECVAAFLELFFEIVQRDQGFFFIQVIPLGDFRCLLLKLFEGLFSILQTFRGGLPAVLLEPLFELLGRFLDLLRFGLSRRVDAGVDEIFAGRVGNKDQDDEEHEGDQRQQPAAMGQDGKLLADLDLFRPPLRILHQARPISVSRAVSSNARLLLNRSFKPNR